MPYGTAPAVSALEAHRRLAQWAWHAGRGGPSPAQTWPSGARLHSSARAAGPPGPPPPPAPWSRRGTQTTPWCPSRLRAGAGGGGGSLRRASAQQAGTAAWHSQPATHRCRQRIASRPPIAAGSQAHHPSRCRRWRRCKGCQRAPACLSSAPQSSAWASCTPWCCWKGRKGSGMVGKRRTGLERCTTWRGQAVGMQQGWLTLRCSD
jgi:hypothetical protein